MSLSAETPTFLLLGVVIILILMAVGVFVLTLVYLQRNQPKKQPSPAPAVRTTLPPIDGAPTAIAKPAVGGIESTPDPTPHGETTHMARLDPSHMPARPGEVMRVIRDQKTGGVVVQVDGQQYTHIREIKDAQVGRRVLWAIADLIRFTGGMAANPQAVRSAAQAKEAEPAASPAAALPGDEALAATLSPAPSLPVAGAPVSTPSLATQRYNMVDFFRRGFQQTSPVAVPHPSSFIDEIEVVLQAYIAGRPVPLSHDVHVKTGSDGKLQIEVGLDVYHSPDEVPDPEIRDLIKTAVAEWERR